jgi:hypothetical protein
MKVAGLRSQRFSGPLSGRRRSPRWRHGGDGSHERQKAACWRAHKQILQINKMFSVVSSQ